MWTVVRLDWTIFLEKKLLLSKGIIYLTTEKCGILSSSFGYFLFFKFRNSDENLFGVMRRFTEISGFTLRGTEAIFLSVPSADLLCSTLFKIDNTMADDCDSLYECPVSKFQTTDLTELLGFLFEETLNFLQTFLLSIFSVFIISVCSWA